MELYHFYQVLTEVGVSVNASQTIRDALIRNSFVLKDVVYELKNREPSWTKLETEFARRSFEIDRELKIEKGMGIQRVHWGEPMYPKQFQKLQDPPFSFSYLGTEDWLHFPLIGVVGSREPQEISYSWMSQHLLEFLKMANCGLVSGGARGIDQNAHEMAILAGRPTLVVLPSGLRRVYPSSLQERLVKWGDSGVTLVSEYPLFSEMRKHCFHHRNRLISGFSEILLVIEARRKSGTLMSAGLAAQQGTPVAVVPAHPSMINLLGNLDLWLDGAQPVRDAQDLVMLFEAEKFGFSNS